MKNRYLQAEMALHGDSLDALADFLGINRITLGRKISYETDFKQSEMAKIRDRYNLTDEKFALIFAKGVNTNESQRSSTTP